MSAYTEPTSGPQAAALLVGLIPVTINANYTIKTSDVGRDLVFDDGNNYTVTIDTFANAAISHGRIVNISNYGAGTITIAAPTGGTLTRLDGTSGTGNRTMAGSSVATLKKKDAANSWGIFGTALS
jgi:hypothetical protein